MQKPLKKRMMNDWHDIPDIYALTGRYPNVFFIVFVRHDNATLSYLLKSQNSRSQPHTPDSTDSRLAPAARRYLHATEIPGLKHREPFPRRHFEKPSRNACVGALWGY